MVLNDCKFWLGGYDLSGFANQLNVEYAAEMLDDTVFSSGKTRSNAPGLKTSAITGTVFVDPAAVTGLGTPVSYDQYLFERIAAAREVVSVAPDGNDPDDPVLFMRGVNGAYTPLAGSVGDLISSDVDLRAAQSVLVRGWLLRGAGTTVTVTGNSSILNHAGPILGQKVVSVLHAVPVSGTTPTLDVIVQSATVVGFGTPTTRLTHPQVTTVRGASWQQADGPITDAYWRATWTVGGTGTPTYLVFLTLGIF